MIVNRRTFDVKPGRMQEAVELVRKAQAALREDGLTGAIRSYVSRIGTLGQLSTEGEYESLTEYGKVWARFSARPTTPAFMEKWYEVVKGGTNEIWTIPD
jgi:hypothetical protein